MTPESNGEQRRSAAVDSRRSSDPAKPRLVAEWALVIELPDAGIAVRKPVASQADAIARGRRCGHATWHIERRYVGPWLPTTPELRTAILDVGRAKPMREFDVEPVADDDEQIAVLAHEPGADTNGGSH